MRLLAKSISNNGLPLTIAHHTSQVMSAARVMLDTIGPQAFKQAGLDGHVDFEDFSNLIMFGSFIHDWGKANDQYLSMLTSGKSEQFVRHEALSATLAKNHPVLAPWLASSKIFADKDWLKIGVIVVAAGHHLKFGNPKNGFKGPFQTDHSFGKIKLFLGHPDFNEMLLLGQELGLDSPPLLVDEIWSFDKEAEDFNTLPLSLIDCKNGLLGRLFQSKWVNGLTVIQKRLVALAKAWVIAADVVASAFDREANNLEEWLSRALLSEPSPEALHDVVQERLAGKTLRPFQVAISNSPHAVTIVEAGCGAGKTLAAYAWAENCKRLGYFGKVFFAYPTTGTATEGYIDHVAKQESVESLLIHGRASVDIADLLGNSEDKYDDIQIKSDSLRNLNAEVIVCSVDTVLGLVQNMRKSLFLSPVLSCGIFIFDEIHAFDDRMFGALLDFLRTFPKARVLLMSASIPSPMRLAIENITGQLAEMPRPNDVEAVTRYIINSSTNAEQAWSQAKHCVANGGKVLWVSNTVGRATKIGQRAQAEGIPVIAYHSRFKYEDRIQKHRAAIDAFSKTKMGCLVVSTQVAEMSLDISADLLVTDIANAPALIQRLGRLNRRATLQNPGDPCDALLLKVGSPLPYLATDIDQGYAFWNNAVKLDRALSQVDLRVLLNDVAQLYPTAKTSNPDSAWLNGGVETVPGVLRDSQSTASVLLEADKLRIISAFSKGSKIFHDELTRCVVPILAKTEIFGWERLTKAPMYPIAPMNRISYDPNWGAAWIE